VMMCFLSFLGFLVQCFVVWFFFLLFVFEGKEYSVLNGFFTAKHKTKNDSFTICLSEGDWLFTEQHQPKKERMTPAAASLVLFPSLAWFSRTEEPNEFSTWRGSVRPARMRSK